MVYAFPVDSAEWFCYCSEMPRPDYPKTMREFRQKFATKAACVEYLIQCRWPDGFVCPRCSGNSGTRISSRPLFQCRNCRYQASVTAGTVMHRSKIPIQDWFVAAYHVTTFTPGLSALQLQRQLGISSHDTAWYLTPEKTPATWKTTLLSQQGKHIA